MSGEASAQSGTTGGRPVLSDPVDPLISQARGFELEAEAAAASAKAKREAADRTADFIKQLKARRDALSAVPAPGVSQAIADLEARQTAENQAATKAQQEADDLAEKARDARTALAALSIRLAPPPPKPQEPKPARTAAVVRETAFGRTFDQIFDDPNAFMRPPAETGGGGAGKDQQAPREVSNASASSIGDRVGVFLFDRPVDRRTSGVSLDLSNDDSRLGLQFSIPRAGKWICRNDGSRRGCTETGTIVSDSPYLNTYSFGVSASSEDNFAQIFTGGDDGGWADKLKATAGIGKTIFRRRNAAQMMYAMQVVENGAEGANLESKCRKDKWSTTPHLGGEEIAAACSGENLRAWALAADTTAGISSFSRGDRRGELLAAVWGQQEPVWDVGLNADLTYRSFSYQNIGSSDPAEIDSSKPFGHVIHKPDEWEWQVSTHFGRFFYRAPPKEKRVGRDEPDFTLGTPVFYAALLSETGQEWVFPDDTEDQQICRPFAPGSTLSRCSELDIAAPRNEWFWRLGVQARFGFRGGSLIPRIGLSPKLTYEVTDGQFAYDVPISFLQSSDGKLNAGMRIKGELWGLNPDSLSVGFFLGTSFNVGK